MLIETFFLITTITTSIGAVDQYLVRSPKWAVFGTLSAFLSAVAWAFTSGDNEQADNFLNVMGVFMLVVAFTAGARLVKKVLDAIIFDKMSEN